MELQKETPAAPSDDAIVALFWQRDERAIRETDRKYGKYLLAVAHNCLGNRSDSEECLDDTYLGAWNAIPPARPHVLQAFLTTILRRNAINRYHANNRHKRVASALTVSLDELEALTDGSDAEDALEAAELARSLSAFVRALPDRESYLFLSRYYCAEPLPAIAAALGCSVSTVKRELAAVKNALKTHLEKEGVL